MTRRYYFGIPEDNSVCLYNNCKKSAYYGYLDYPRDDYEKKSYNTNIFCNTHRLRNMANIKVKCCRVCYNDPYCMLPKTAIYNYPEVIDPIVCRLHIIPGMVDVLNSKCSVDLCNIRASFIDTSIDKLPKCVGHSTRERVNNVSSRCKKCNMTTRPNSNMKNGDKCKSCYTQLEMKNSRVVEV